MNKNKDLIYNLPDELKLYIISFIPIKKCLYCHIYTSNYNENIYCSNYCNTIHNIIILKRISNILFLHLFFQFKLLFILFVNTSIVLFYFLCLYSLFQLLYSMFYCNNLFQNDCCSIY